MIYIDENGFGRDDTKSAICRYIDHEEDCPDYSDFCAGCAIGMKQDIEEDCLNLEKWTSIGGINEILEQLPNDADCYYYIAVTYFKDRDYRAALENVNRTLAIDPVHGPALYYKARIFANIRKSDDALKVLDALDQMYTAPKIKELRRKLLDSINHSSSNDDSHNAEVSVCRQIEKETEVFLKAEFLYDSWRVDRGRFSYVYNESFPRFIRNNFGQNLENIDEKELMSLIRHTFCFVACRLITGLYDNDLVNKTLMDDANRLLNRQNISVVLFESLIKRYFLLILSIVNKAQLTEKVVNTIICNAGSVAGCYIVPFAVLQNELVRHMYENVKDIQYTSEDEVLDLLVDIINNGFEERLSILLGTFATFSSKAYDIDCPNDKAIISHFKYMRLYCQGLHAQKAIVEDIPIEVKPKSVSRGTHCIALFDSRNDMLSSILFPSVTNDFSSITGIIEVSKGTVLTNEDGRRAQCMMNKEYKSAIDKETRIKITY